jgi:DNA-binding transcriptional regulator YhcF (GntR family)
MQKIEQQNFITKKRGSTYYIVSVRSSDQAKETFNDKLLRIVKADTTATEKEAVTC